MYIFWAEISWNFFFIKHTDILLGWGHIAVFWTRKTVTERVKTRFWAHTWSKPNWILRTYTHTKNHIVVNVSATQPQWLRTRPIFINILDCSDTSQLMLIELYCELLVWFLIHNQPGIKNNMFIICFESRWWLPSRSNHS